MRPPLRLQYQAGGSQSILHTLDLLRNGVCGQLVDSEVPDLVRRADTRRAVHDGADKGEHDLMQLIAIRRLLRWEMPHVL